VLCCLDIYKKPSITYIFQYSKSLPTALAAGQLVQNKIKFNVHKIA
jgi:hypothetical protein